MVVFVVPSTRESSSTVFVSKGISSVSLRSFSRTRWISWVAPSSRTVSSGTSEVSVSSTSPRTFFIASPTVRAVTSKVSWPYWPTKVTVLRVTTETSPSTSSREVSGAGLIAAPSALYSVSASASATVSPVVSSSCSSPSMETVTGVRWTTWMSMPSVTSSSRPGVTRSVSLTSMPWAASRSPTVGWEKMRTAVSSP